MDRPSFSLEIQARIERAREEVFKDAESRFDMLFFPILHGLFGVDLFSAKKDVPVQRKPASLKLQFTKYTDALFDAEAVHYPSLASSSQELALWLGNLAERINKEVRKIAEDERHNFHCGLSERLDAVTDALAARAQWWMEAKQRADSKPIVSQAPRPITPLATLAPPKQFRGLLQPGLPPEPKKTVGELLDDIVLTEDISHEELAGRIGLSRSVYFVVKSGKGSHKARKKMDLYLSSRSTKNQD